MQLFRKLTAQLPGWVPTYPFLLLLQKEAQTGPLSPNATLRRSRGVRNIKKSEWLTHKFNYLAPTQEKNGLSMSDLLSWKPTDLPGGGGGGAASPYTSF